MDARTKFSVGDRVRLNAVGLAHRAATGSTRTPTAGRVTGFPHRDNPGVIVLRDGRKTAVLVHADWWEVDASAPRHGLTPDQVSAIVALRAWLAYYDAPDQQPALEAFDRVLAASGIHNEGRWAPAKVRRQSP